MKVRSALPLMALFLVVGHGLPLQAWKTKAAIVGTVHGWQAERAGQLLRLRNPANAQEWDRFTHAVFLACGTLDNDGNAHGNALPAYERKDPDGGTPITTQALTFNGGPMFRWWVRALEAHGQVDTGIPERYLVDASWPTDKDVWRRSSPRDGDGRRIYRRPGDVYRYLGFMVHLVQDNSSPAHMANVRHGPWDGVEWWHWNLVTAAGGVGGEGVNQPELAQTLLAKYGAWLNAELSSKKEVLKGNYWKMEFLISNKRGSRQGGVAFDYTTLTNRYLESIINSNRDLVMPGIIEKINEVYPYYFQPFPRGRLLEENLAKMLWEYEAEGSVTGYWASFTHGLGNGPIDPFDARPLFQDPSVPGNLSQFKFSPQELNAVIVGGQRVDFTAYPAKPSQRWIDLNAGTTPWLPNPAYVGEAFDARWGSYGGRWGFPGRIPVEGFVDLITYLNLVEDFASLGKGRITPGDLYTMHHPAGTYDDARQDPDTQYFKWDERPLGPITSPLAEQRLIGWQADLGQEMVNRSTLWSCVLMDTFSQALPPVVARFTAEPRKPVGSAYSAANDFPAWYDQRVLPWCAGTAGAKITVQLDLNRKDDYTIELFAVPRRQFNTQDNWYRSIVFGNTIWPSDLSVTEDPRTPGRLPQDAYPTRTYDYAYSQLMGYPLVLTRGFRSVQDVNFLDTNPTEVLPQAVSINPAELAFQATETTQAPNLEDRYCWTFKAELTWTGEVHDPIRILDGSGNLGGNTPASGMDPLPPPQPLQGKNLLPSGDYFLLLVAYRNGWRPAFARNQYKFLTPSKEVLEFSDWNVGPWTDKYVKDAIVASQQPGATRTTMIPDELCPIRVDTLGPKVSIE